MKSYSKHIRCRNVLAFFLAFVVGVTFIPLTGVGVFAEEEQPADPETAVLPAQENGTDDGMEIDMEKLLSSEDQTLEISGEDLDIAAAPDSDIPALPSNADTSGIILSDDLYGSGLTDVAVLDQQLGIMPTDGATMLAQEDTSPVQIVIEPKTGIITITATAADGDAVTKLYVDNKQQTVSGLGTQQVKVEYDTKQLPVGFHDVKLTTKNGKTLSYAVPVPTLIYAKPEHSKKMYELYHNYGYLTTAGNTYSRDPSCGLYLSHRIKKKSYTTNGPLDANSTYTISGLTPNKTYEFLAFFGKYVTYGGEQLFIAGPMNNYVSKLVMKTGLKKLPIKSVKVKAVNVKKHTHIVPGYVVRNAGKETWYTYRLKVTVKMKKKPGIKALYISGKKVKGNKKSYSVKFGKSNSIYTGKWVVKPYRKYYKHTIAKIPRKTTYVVKLYSYRDKTYKGYSPIQTKKPKIH